MLSQNLKSFTVLSLFFYTLLNATSHNPTLQDRSTSIHNSLFASTLGDALGRVTEFIPTIDAQFARYPHGVRSSKDFLTSDWEGLPKALSTSKSAPYTDDTRMALLVSDVLIQSAQLGWDLEHTMSSLAEAFIKDLDNPSYGWAAHFRAPGISCLKGVRQLKSVPSSQKTNGWWNVKALEAGGCGSVMRAFPFGLIFSHDPHKAKLWAVEHSKITHGHPRALSSCAAMAVGIAYALQAQDITSPDTIISKMIDAAQEYHPDTAQKIRTAAHYAKEAQKLIINACNYDPFSPYKNCWRVTYHFDISKALKDPAYKSFHEKVFTEFAGWAADDAIAAAVYVFALFPHDLSAAMYLAVHTPGDSDSIASMAGALIGAFTRKPFTITTKLEDTPWLEKTAQHISAL